MNVGLTLGTELGFGIGEPLGGVSALPPDFVNFDEVWHSEFNLTPSAWVGLKRSLSLAGTGTPTVGADGTHFRGKQVAQAARTGSKAWRATGLTTGIASGTRPYFCAIVRGRTVETVNVDVTAAAFGGGSGGTEDQHRLMWQQGSEIEYRRRYGGGNLVAVTSTDTQDTDAHFFEWLVDATLGLLVYRDGVLLASNNGASTTNTLLTGVTYVGAGCLASAAANFSDSSIAMLGMRAAAPDAATRVSLLAYSRDYWGTT